MLASDPNWTQLDKAQRDAILATHEVEAVPPVATGTEGEILASLGAMNLGTWRDRREALANRFAQVRLAAAKLVAPKAVHVTLPSRTLKDEAAVRAWLAEVEASLLDKAKVGPVVGSRDVSPFDPTGRIMRAMSHATSVQPHHEHLVDRSRRFPRVRGARSSWRPTKRRGAARARSRRGRRSRA